MTIVNDMILEFDHSFVLTLEDADTTDPIGIERRIDPTSLASIITYSIRDDEGN